MYLDHFHLTKPPFENTPDPFFFLREGQYRDALAAMVYSVASRKGMVAVAGPTGCGKTTLSHVLLEYLPEKTQVISLVHLTARPLELLTLVALELGIHPPPDSPLLLTRALQESLLKRAEADQTVVLTIDEAQALTVDLCQELLLLSNLETHTHKLIQIMLLGRPAFIDLLDHPDLVAFKQRVSMVQRLFPLTGEQTRLYIGHRLSLAGGETRVFTPAALDRIQALSSGIPRLINRVADMALLKAFMADRMEADAGLVDQVGRDLGTGWAGEVIRDVPGRSWPNAGSRLEEPPASASPPRSMEPEGQDELGDAPDSALSTVEPAPVVPTAEADASGPAFAFVRPRTAPHITAAHRIPKRSELSPAQVRNGSPPTMAVASKPPSPGVDRPTTRRRRYYWWVAAPLILALLALAFWLGMLYQNRAAGEGGRSSRSVQLPETPSSLAEAQAGQTKPAAPVSPPVIGPGSAPEPSLSAHLPDPPDAFIEPFGDSVLRRSDDPAMAAAGSGTAGSLNPKRPAGPVGGTDSASAAAEPSSVRPSPDSPPDPSATDGPAVEPESGIGPDPKRPFSLLVASFLKKERAAQAMLVFKEKGVDTYWVRQDNREKGQVFMVLTYGFATKEEAAQVRVDKNLKGSLIQDRPLGILMGRSDKVDDLQPLAGSLATAGYSPYWVPSADGVFFLFVGAFRTEETARKEWDRLAADGFQGRIVQR